MPVDATLPRSSFVVFLVITGILAATEAFPLYPSGNAVWEEVYVETAGDYVDDGGQFGGPDCVFGDYGFVGLPPPSPPSLDPDVEVFDTNGGAVYDDAGPADVFELGDDLSYDDVFAKLVAWLQQVDDDQPQADAEQMAMSFLDELSST